MSYWYIVDLCTVYQRCAALRRCVVGDMLLSKEYICGTYANLAHHVLSPRCAAPWAARLGDMWLSEEYDFGI